MHRHIPWVKLHIIPLGTPGVIVAGNNIEHLELVAIVQTQLMQRHFSKAALPVIWVEVYYAKQTVIAGFLIISNDIIVLYLAKMYVVGYMQRRVGFAGRIYFADN